MDRKPLPSLLLRRKLPVMLEDDGGGIACLQRHGIGALHNG